jgi:hypothetical protein
MPTHREIVATQIRRLVAEVYGWSFGGTKEGTRINYHMTGRHELAQRINDELGVMVPDVEWPHIVNVGKLIDYVNVQIEREYANAD